MMTLTKEMQKKVEENIGLVGKVIKDKIHISQNLNFYSYDDLFQIGCVGLCKAVYSDEGGTFSTYAYRLIWNEICDTLRYGMKKSEKEQLMENINNIQSEETTTLSFETQIEYFETINKIKKDAPNGIAKGIDALLMSAVGGYSCKEIGEKLNRRTNLVTAQMSKARKYLREISEFNTLYIAGEAL